MTRPRALALTWAVALAGCGVSDPYNDAPQARPETPTATATPSADGRAAGDAGGALQRFAETYVNWTFESLPTMRERIADQATGDLREQLLQEAREASDEASRRVSTQSNQGEVQGVLLRPGKPAFVITYETASFGSEAQESVYMLYEAQVERTGSGWKVSDWRAVN